MVDLRDVLGRDVGVGPDDRPAGRSVAQPDRVIVLGGTGFLGSAVARAFLDSGSDVTVVARHEPTDSLKLRLAGVRFVTADAGDGARIGPLLDRTDLVVHTVGSMLPQESNANPSADVTTSLPALLALLEQLRDRPQVALTFISSGGTVYGNPAQMPVSERSLCNPITSYGVVKLAAEKFIGMYSTLYGIPSRILRVSNVYGPGQPTGRSQGIVGAFLAATRRGEPLHVFGDGRSLRDYIHVDDVADAVVALARSPRQASVINVGSGTGRTILDVLEVVGKVAGAQPKVEFLPDRGFDVRAIVLDTTLLAGLVQWDPTPFELGVERTWNELLSQTASVARAG